ncbi:MAG: hypothetical protein EA351_01535 [Gemmatimonadales bacterium]|nr:MAG: hypothetical protein EA351_01535 [Gemmatimonadales bacterium]
MQSSSACQFEGTPAIHEMSRVKRARGTLRRGQSGGTNAFISLLDELLPTFTGLSLERGKIMVGFLLD